MKYRSKSRLTFGEYYQVAGNELNSFLKNDFNVDVIVNNDTITLEHVRLGRTHKIVTKLHSNNLAVLEITNITMLVKKLLVSAKLNIIGTADKTSKVEKMFLSKYHIFNIIKVLNDDVTYSVA